MANSKKYAHKEDWNTSFNASLSPEGKVMTDDFKLIIDTILQEDLVVSKKQRHTSKKIEGLQSEHDFKEAYPTVCNYVKTAKEKLY